jgi:hypothetical protein
VQGPALIEIELKISDAGVRSLLAISDQEFENAWIEAMAAALPRAHLAMQVFRDRLGDRIRVYGRAARFAFEQSGGAEIEAIAGRIDYSPDVQNPIQLRRIDRGEVASGGLPDLGLKVLWTSDTPNTRPSGRCRRAKDALDRLADAIARQQGPDQVEQTFQDLQTLITRPYECRLLGRVVASLVASRAADAMIRTVRVTPEDGPSVLI